jgi:predicted dehydrogenase
VTGLEIDELCAEVSSFIPGHRLDDDSMMLVRFKGGAKGILYASQISSGEENGLNIRVYGTKKGLQWWQEEPNYLVLKDPAGFQTRLSRGNPDLVCDIAKEYMRTPFGHPEGFIEASQRLPGGLQDDAPRWPANPTRRPTTRPWTTVAPARHRHRPESRSPTEVEGG